VASPTARPTAAATAQTGNTAQLSAGKAAFTSSCGTCHTLTAASTSGTLGPSLNGIGSLRTADWIVAQIQNPCAPGHANAAGPKYTCSIMPPNIVSGAQAQAIAAYLASQKQVVGPGR
jgi:mono/diheme cytochrome c family protein